jgi:hypothetical protein
MKGKVLGIIKKKLFFIMEKNFKIEFEVFGYVHHIKMKNGINST